MRTKKRKRGSPPKKKVPMTWGRKIRNWNSGIRKRGGDIKIPQEMVFPLDCHYCNVILGPSNCSLDHAFPIQRGGRELWSNYDFICFTCNRAKGVMDKLEFTSLCNLLNTFNEDIRNLVLKKLRAAWRVR